MSAPDPEKTLITSQSPTGQSDFTQILSSDKKTGGSGSSEIRSGSTFTASIPSQDLSTDTLIVGLPKVEFEGQLRPSLGGLALLAKLGQGGMGAVYYGMHPRLNKEVAVKVLPSSLSEQRPELVQRFLREGQIAAKIQSPHLVSVYDVNREGNIFYLVMEFVSGKSAGEALKQVTDTGKPGLPIEVALDICIAATEGLVAAHSEGVIHRDLKPDNIMIPKIKRSDDLNFKAAKLADLGLARENNSDSSLTGAQICMGTAGYMSPEQIADAKNCGPASDVFSMGASLYALLSGKPPFTGDSLMRVLLNTTEVPHQPVRRTRSDVSLPLSMVVDRCLSKFPNKRFPDAAALLEALKGCRSALDQPMPQNGTGIKTAPIAIRSAPPQGSSENRPIRSTKKSLGWIGVVSVIGILACGTGWYFLTHGSAHNPMESTQHAAPTATQIKNTSVNDTPKLIEASAATPLSIQDQTLDLGNGVNLELVSVPAGTINFITGEKRNLTTFQIGKYPVTVEQFRRFTEETSYKTEQEKQSKSQNWNTPGFSQTPDCPVVWVSYEDATQFVRWLSGKSKRDVKLPTSVEWEYAARGAENSAYPWGDQWDGSKANHADQSLKNNHETAVLSPQLKISTDTDGYAFTSPVGKFKNPSWCGAFDMSGNVWQWCRHPMGGLAQVLHGGSWNTSPEKCRVSVQRPLDADYRSNDCGFRVTVLKK